MELHLWLSFVIICFLGALSPGPSLAVVLKNTINGGYKSGSATAISHGFGVTLYAIISITGIGIVIAESPALFNLIKYAGAAFLLYLGVKGLMSKKSAVLVKDQSEETNKSVNGWRDGFLIAFLNPKLAIFFIALFSQFVQPDASWLQQFILVATVGTLDTLWYLIVAFFISREAFLNKLHRNSHIIDRIAGSVLVLLAIRVVTT
ncbi:LysE family translocator [Endozoicomonas sp. G2_1]|uniref:LysE family translocator n=1 Tax=Endozoicomonas sp. G2_1 TaxID=2821091 RepID=UPI001AD9D9B7|nr:LysE family translocator [Endozoicomonas sp. G2_1]MBO9491121.1 LysE family translocator [Endozoicomonas sp. G2_1]